MKESTEIERSSQQEALDYVCLVSGLTGDVIPVAEDSPGILNNHAENSIFILRFFNY